MMTGTRLYLCNLIIIQIISVNQVTQFVIANYAMQQYDVYSNYQYYIIV